MRDGWRTALLAELCEIDTGDSDTKDAVPDGAYAFFDRSRTIKRSRRYIFNCEALIIPGEGTEFLPRKYDGKFDLHQRAYALHKFTEKVSRDYLYYYLVHRSGYWGEVAVGATVKSLRRRHFEGLDVPVPPLEEQWRIVAVLDEAFAAVDAALTSLAKSLALIRSTVALKRERTFQALSEAPHFHLREMASDYGRGKSKHRPRNDPILYGGPYPFVQTGDIRAADSHVVAFSQTYNDVGLRQSKLWPAGTVCITIAANIAETAILTFNACFPDSVIGFVPDTASTTSRYVEYMLQYTKSRLQSLGKGSAQDNINLGTFEGMTFPFPPRSEQAMIVDLLDSLQREASAYAAVQSQKAAALAELKQSLLARAFSGALTADKALAA